MTQADADRDLISIALIEIDGFRGINERFGFDSGDRLLASVGAGLVANRSPSSSIARLGNAEFGVVSTISELADLTRLISPIVTSARSEAAVWAARESAWHGAAIGEPALAVGMASGVGAEVWRVAADALATARLNPAGGAVQFRAGGQPATEAQRTLSQRYRQEAAVEAAVGLDELGVTVQEIGCVAGPAEPWVWHRFEAALRSPDGEETIETATLRPALARSVERWLVDQAALWLTASDRSSRATIPIPAEAARARSFAQRLFPLIERRRVPPSRVVFEFSEECLIRGGPRVDRLVAEVRSIGASVLISECQGSYACLEKLKTAKVTHLKPAAAFTAAAINGDPAAIRSMQAFATSAEDARMVLIAPRLPESLDPTTTLSELGFTYAERPNYLSANWQENRAPSVQNAANGRSA